MKRAEHFIESISTYMQSAQHTATHTNSSSWIFQWKSLVECFFKTTPKLMVTKEKKHNSIRKEY